MYRSAHYNIKQVDICSYVISIVYMLCACVLCVRVQNNEFVMHGHRCRTKPILCGSFRTCTEISCYT